MRVYIDFDFCIEWFFDVGGKIYIYVYIFEVIIIIYFR